MRFWLVGALVLLGLVACSSAQSTPTPTPRFVSLPLEGRVVTEEDLAHSAALAREAAELRRVRDEHRRLIASMPPTPEATVTPAPFELQEDALARVLANPGGIPVMPAPEEDWFDLREGLTFYRERGDDWTSRRVRENHTHRGLFYFEGYPDGVPNFADRSIYPDLAREMAFEASEVMPLLGDPSPAMVRSFARALGWELRDSEGPVVNLWTRFTVLEDGESHVFVVGGVMRMGVASLGEGEERLEYVTAGSWIGPVVVERLR